MSKVLIDTNLLVYSVDRDSKYYERSSALMESDTLELVTSSKNIVELLVVLTKSRGYNLTSQLALEIVSAISSRATIIYPNYKSITLLRDLVKKYEPKGLRIHDMEIIAISLAYDINLIATLNIKDFSTVTEIDLLEL
ncbi:MAG: type II toxin-antitoxin system VapC family toxin [Bacteroidota bacterium]